jgi:hypothetical protein
MTDTVPLTLHIQPPQFAVDYEVLSVDPLTRIHTMRVSNTGDTVTDYNFQLLEADSGLPAEVIVNPDLSHVYLQEDEELVVEVIPLALEDAPAPAGPVGTGYVAESCGAETCVSQALAYTPTCDDDRHVEETVEDIPINLTSNSWYCTNRPNIDVTFQLPYLGYTASIFEASISAAFSSGAGGDVYAHLTEIGLNGVGLKFGEVPTNPVLEAIVPSNMINLGGGPHVVNLRSIHNIYGENNNAHYIVGTDFHFDLIAQDVQRELCQPNDEPPPPPPPDPLYCPIILPQGQGQ